MGWRSALGYEMIASEMSEELPPQMVEPTAESVTPPPVDEPPLPLPSPPDPSLKRTEHQLTRLLALSLDGTASPSIRLKALQQKHEDAPYGWGFAWYPAQSSCAMVLKDPTSVEENAMTKLLSDWERFESTVFMCHLRGAARTISEQETQPFVKSYAGRDFVLAHNGDLFADLQVALPLGDNPALEPIGRTDSEHAFSWMLSKMGACGARRLADLGWPTLLAWLQGLDALGTANFLLTDGLDLCAYRDLEGYNGLGWTRLVPPHGATHFEADDFTLGLEDLNDRNRSVVMVMTHPIKDLPFVEMEPGQLLVFRRGVLTFDSARESRSTVTPSLPLPMPIQSAPRETQSPTSPPTSQLPSQLPSPPTSQSPLPPPLQDPAQASAQPAAASAQLANAASEPAAELPSKPEVAPPTPIQRIERLVLPASLPLPQGRILSVVHDTVYRYTTPVERSVHLYRLRPVHDAAQNVLAHTLDITVDGLRRDYEDVFGNLATHLELETPYTELRITSRSLVSAPLGPSPYLQSPARRRQTIPLIWMPWQRQMMLPYLLPPELPETQLTELYDYAMNFVERQDHDLVHTLLDMNLTIYRDFRYVSGSTTLETTPFEVYLSRQGVCQDFANLLICLARLLGIPARYRVGYVFTGAGYENKVQSEATHAWAELHLPWMGWHGFDPTNGCLVGRDHVRVAAGRNYRDATPTSGTLYKGGGGETMVVDVRVEEG